MIKSQRYEFFYMFFLFLIMAWFQRASRWFFIILFSFLPHVIFLIPLYMLKFSFSLKVLLSNNSFKIPTFQIHSFIWSILFIYFLFVYLFIYLKISIIKIQFFKKSDFQIKFLISKIPVFTFTRLNIISLLLSLFHLFICLFPLKIPIIKV